MAKKRVVDTMDFINEVYGMTASYESSDYGYGARGRKAYSSEYTKPVNAYALAEALAFIKADEYKQTAQTAVITALGEHARLLNNMRKKGYSNREIRSFAESSGFGEVSLEEVKDTVVEGAKDAWKAFLALIDKLIEVVKQFIRGLFDKEKKLASVIGKVKSARKRVEDAGKADTAADLKVAFLNKNFAGFFGFKTKDGQLIDGSSGGELQSFADSTGEVMNGDTVKGLITSGASYVQFVARLAKNLNISVPAQLSRIFNYTYDSENGAALNKKNTNTPTGKFGWDSINVDKYKADWNTFMDVFKDVIKEIKGTKGTEKNTVKRSADRSEIEGIGVSVSSIPRGANAIKTLAKYLQSTEQTLGYLKAAKINKNLEKTITALGNLKRDIIKNKDSKYSNKTAQLGRIAIGKVTQVITLTISLMNMMYTALFKAAAVNVKSTISVTEKDSSARKDFDED